LEKRTRKFLIGFDRYVQLDWCELTLEAAIESKTTEDVKDQISTKLTGAESRRKTFDILKRLWLQPIEGCQDFSSRGVELYRKNGAGSVSPLSWGSAMVTYPFFGKTAEITGRLLSIQGDCSIKEVQRRMAEIYGDRDGISRAVSRVLQSQESWGMIERVEKGKRLIRKAPITLNDEQVVIWMIEAVIRFTGKAVSLSNLQSMPLLYPFVLDQSLAYAVSSSKKLEIRTEGVGSQFVALREK
jgi:hypothetical protein